MRWSLIPQGAVAHVAKDWQQFFGLTESEIVGGSDRQSVHLQDRSSVASIMRHAVDDREPFVICFRQRKADGTFAWVMAGGSPSFSPADGHLIGYLGETDVLSDAPEAPKTADILRRLPHRSKHRTVMLDRMADHIMTARAMAKHAEDQSVRTILDAALLSIGHLLYKSLRR